MLRFRRLIPICPAIILLKQVVGNPSPADPINPMSGRDMLRSLQGEYSPSRAGKGSGVRSYPHNPTSSKNSKTPVSPRGFVAVFVGVKCRSLYLAQKILKIQSNAVFFVNTKNWLPDRNYQTITPWGRGLGRTSHFTLLTSHTG